MADEPTLVLIPGVICDHLLWEPIRGGLERLVDIHVTDAQYRYPSLEQIADAILAEAPERFALGGLSFGGYVAMEIMRRAPQRVDRLALLNTSARTDTAERKAERERLVEQARIGRFIGVTSRLASQFVHPDRANDQDLIETIQAMARTVGRDGYIMQQQAILARPDARPYLGRIACPTLALVGRQDARTPVALHEEIHALIPGSELVVLEDCGHLSPLERPDEVVAAMAAWLQKPVSKSAN